MNTIDLSALNIERLTQENKRLEFENQLNSMVVYQQQEQFRKVIDQMVHDIRSPLSSLQMIAQFTDNMPENERVTLRAAALNIADITNKVLNQYGSSSTNTKVEQRQPVLISASILQILGAKRYEYKNLDIEFTHEFADDSNFAFVKIEPSSFKQMLSNILNNAVQALEDTTETRQIKLWLDVNNEWVILSIVDHGCGMPEELVNKIMNNISVTESKTDEHGIGLTQVRETLQRNLGKLEISSEVGAGTKVTLFLPKIVLLNWIVNEITLIKDELIIILDDDDSIHMAWDNKLVPLLQKTPTLTVKHFTQGIEAIDFINKLSPKQKENILLLTDYEFLKQEYNGLDVIRQTDLKRAILVTSHYDDLSICQQTSQMGFKVLPKLLVFNVRLKVDKKIIPGSKRVDMVWVDDDKAYMQNLIEHYYSHLKIDRYHDPMSFMESVAQYPLNTKIVLDNYYHAVVDFHSVDGIEIARQLHEKGYDRVYILSGGDVYYDVNYVTVLLKTDTHAIQNLDKL